jgi:hypothetical protein
MAEYVHMAPETHARVRTHTHTHTHSQNGSEFKLSIALK